MLRLLTRFLFVATVSFVGCDSGESEDGDPSRVALMTLRFENTEDSGDVTAITATDPDGDGVFSYAPDALVFRRESLYEGTVEVLETAGGDDLAADIRADPEEYLFDYFMRTDDGVNSTAFPFDRETDYDPDGRELWAVGLRFRVSVASSSSGSGLFTAMLRRYESGAKEVGSDRFVNVELPPPFPVAVVAPPPSGRAAGR